ncbi:molybdopterin-guanine dinucleotide biosynthesis protein A [Salipiger pallidus]|uniref:Molybdopterin-guanine dinucleotide biosynthesis protein A n=1 Tax=Salipiger pallidus TaxID=1775170 RepID=A0A8J2ZL14_9RHOB|nr:nucleotidyltransferase family protein [Salipiger pallidus]GGG76561.1 molybdopterin-guanine dinucleotide biosynthesis protein A [Salipiger pallidus]
MGGIAVLIPAAGASRRMRGTDKLLMDVAGEPLLRRQARLALAAAQHVCVALPGAASDHAAPRAEALRGLAVQIVEVADADLGMSSALRRGVAMLPPGHDGVMILPADMPDIEAEDLSCVIDAFFGMPCPTVQQATSEDGVPGHPVLFPADCIPSFLSLAGDRGARTVLAANRHRVRYVPLPGSRALVDLDTPEAWQAWSAARNAAE